MRRPRMPALTFATMAGETLATGGMCVTPAARVLIVRLPFGGFVWAWPTAAVVERDGQVQRVPVIDATRIVQLALWTCGVAAWLVARRTAR